MDGSKIWSKLTVDFLQNYSGILANTLGNTGHLMWDRIASQCLAFLSVYLEPSSDPGFQSFQFLFNAVSVVASFG